MKGAPVSFGLSAIRAAIAAFIELIWVVTFTAKRLVHSPAPVWFRLATARWVSR